MIVFRIEDADGQGPYRTCNKSFECAFENDFLKHPTPFQDSLLSPLWRKLDRNERDQFSCAFKSEEQLNSWFYNQEFLEWLHANGFHMALYRAFADEVLIGHSQVAFKKSDAALITAISLLE
jgi:hypothetical protein